MVKAKQYPSFSENSIQVQNRRYLAKDEEGKVVETPEGMFSRVASNLSRPEVDIYGKTEKERVEVQEDFYDLIRSLLFLPNSPTLMNAGRRLQMLSACFVLPIEDTMESIFSGVYNTAMIHKSGGGTGFSFSRLRPKGDVVGSTGGVASGPVSFIDAFDTATDVVKQGGTRRGANMAILNIDHPDIMEFITVKESGTRLQNFNISVAVTVEWMKKAAARISYDLVSPHSEKVTGQLNAGEVFDKICNLAWKTGDPGLWFIDRVNDTNPNAHLGKIESCNPCGEQELLPYESCNLGSINLSAHIVEGKIDWETLGSTCGRAVHFLDNVIDANRLPLPEIAEMSKKTRRIGVGVMGWADMLIRLGIRYDSQKALDLARRVMKFIHEKIHDASCILAHERGSYPAFEGSSYVRPMRNTSPVTIAPTGTISIIAGCSSGIEPLFALSYKRNVMDHTILTEGYDPFREKAMEGGYYSEELMSTLAEVGSLEALPKEMKDTIPKDVLSVFRVSHDISPEWHVYMQAAFQENTDNSVSKTINLPAKATVEDVRESYIQAFTLGCKGVTVYRDGSKSDQVLSFGSNGRSPTTNILPTRPRSVDGKTEKVVTGHGNIYVTLNHWDGELREVFATQGKAGGCDAAQMEAVSRLTTLCLKGGIDPKEVSAQLRGITCCPAWDDGIQVRSGPDAIAIAMDRFLGSPISPIPDRGGLVCPDCYSFVISQEGCMDCPTCGWSKCV